MKLFYQVWVDCIARLRSMEINKNNWKSKSMIVMTISMTLNFALLMSVIQKHVLDYYFYKLEIPFLSNYENNIITILVLFILPCIIVNYLFIFRANRYEKLLKKYSKYNGKLFLSYFTISMFLPIILMWISVFSS
jgi:membrane protein YdbS with pleckstrin-like domain